MGSGQLWQQSSHWVGWKFVAGFHGHESSIIGKMCGWGRKYFKVFFPIDCDGGLTFDGEDFLLMGESFPPFHHNWKPWSQSSLGTIIIGKFDERPQIFLLYRVMKNSDFFASFSLRG